MVSRLDSFADPGRASLASGTHGEASRICTPTPPVAHVLRVRGDLADASMIEALEAGFSQRTGVRFINSLHGPESTLAGVYTGVADIAFMPREIREPMERMAFQWALLERPFVLSIANAPIDRDCPSAQLAVLVHSSNPLARVSLDDLDGIFGAEHLRGQTNLRTWGQLGLDGAWRDRPIVPIISPVDSIASLFVRRSVMLDSRKWNPALQQVEQARAIAELDSEPSGIAILPAHLRSIRVRPVAVAPGSGDFAVALDRNSVVDGSYPLLRKRTAVMHRSKDVPLRPELRRFMSFILSEEGQEIVDRSGVAIALDRRAASTELAKLQ